MFLLWDSSTTHHSSLEFGHEAADETQTLGHNDLVAEEGEHIHSVLALLAWQQLTPLMVKSKQISNFEKKRKEKEAGVSVDMVPWWSH